MKKLIAIIILSASSVAAQTLAPGATMLFSSSTSIDGTGMPDQWGNDWLQVDSDHNEKTATVSIFDCAGNQKKIGTVPIASLGSGNNFSGFHPFMDATLRDLNAVSVMSKWERSEELATRETRPQRRDCRIVEQEVTNNGQAIESDAWQTWQAMHPPAKKK